MGQQKPHEHSVAGLESYLAQITSAGENVRAGIEVLKVLEQSGDVDRLWVGNSGSIERAIELVGSFASEVFASSQRAMRGIHGPSKKSDTPSESKRTSDKKRQGKRTPKNTKKAPEVESP